MIKARSAECRLPRSATGDDQIRAMRAAAWHSHGLVVVDPEEVIDPWHREVLKQIGAKMYGQRRAQG